jgi:Predicted esterase of the alpha-beta hydrolase superfamily
MADPLDLSPGVTPFSWAELAIIASGDDVMVQKATIGKSMAAQFAAMRGASGEMYRSQISEAFTTMLKAKISGNSVLCNDPALMADVQAAFKDIINRSFEGPEVAGMTFKEVVLRANSHARNLLQMLNSMEHLPPGEHEPWSDIPQLRLDSSSDSVSMALEKPRPETLVLKGGGCKGIGYIQTFKTLQEEGMLRSVRSCIGSSIGSITATGLACGVSVTGGNARESDLSALGTLLGEVCDLRLRDPRDYTTTYPSLDDEIPSSKGILSGKDTFAIIERTTSESVRSFLLEAGLGEPNAPIPEKWQEVLGAGDEERLRLLAAGPTTDDRTDHMITFADLALLSRLAPGTFRNLTVTAWSKEEQKTLFLDAKTTPNMPVALAARASMAIPMAYAPVRYKIGDRVHTLYDGGLGNNMPIDYALRQHLPNLDDDALNGRRELTAAEKRDLAVARSRVLGLAFDEGGKAFSTIHQPITPKDASIDRVICAWWAHMGNATEAKNADRNRIHDHGSRNVLIVPHDGVSTLSFRKFQNDETRRKAYITAMHNTLKFLDLHENKGYVVSVSAEEYRANIATVTKNFSEAQKQALVQHLREEFLRGNPGHQGPVIADEDLLRFVRGNPEEGAAPFMSKEILGRFLPFPPEKEREARTLLASILQHVLPR